MNIHKNIKARLNFEIGRLNIKFLEHSNKKCHKIWVVGCGRSGTTWLSNLINYTENLSFLFEPIHNLVLSNSAKEIVNKYIRSKENNINQKKLITSIFSHELYHNRLYADKYRIHSNKLNFKYTGILVKDINVNLMTKWARNNFPDIKIVFLMRHPFAVTVSQSKLSHWEWVKEPEFFFNQNKLYEDYLFEFTDLLKIAKSDFEKRILIWAIQHYVPLIELEQDDCLIVFYENLCIDPINELKKIFNFLGIDYSEDQEERLRDKFITPSSVTMKDSAIVTGKSLIDTWKNELSSAQINNGLEILSQFSLDNIYNDQLLPNEEGLRNFSLVN